MKKLMCLFLIAVLFCTNAFAAWDKSAPAGTSNASDIDTNVIANNTALESTFSGIYNCRNLVITNSGSATAVTVTADMVLLQAAASIAYRATSVSESIAITTSGASGLVSSLSETSGTWYYIWIARKSSDGTTNGYLSTATDLTTFLTQVDSGYDQASLVGVVRNDGSSNFMSFHQNGNEYWYDAWQTIASGNVSTVAWIAIDMTSYVPSTLSNIAFGNMSGPVYTQMSNINTTVVPGSAMANNYLADTSNTSETIAPWLFNIITANTLYWISAGASCKIQIAGFKLNKI